MARKAGLTNKPRTDSITVRLDPRTRYGLELLARKQHRTLTGVVEWAIQGAFNSEYGLIEKNSAGEDINLLQELWDVDESDRLIKLAWCRPELLNYEEEMLWKLIKENDHFWFRGKNELYSNKSELGNLLRPLVRECWKDLNMVAKGQAHKDTLPYKPSGLATYFTEGSKGSE